jgi:hypothetical protein
MHILWNNISYITDRTLGKILSKAYWIVSPQKEKEKNRQGGGEGRGGRG